MTEVGLGPAWLPLGPGTLDGVPESRGVFVLGTIVRSPLLVGVAEDRGLRSAVAEAVRGGRYARRDCKELKRTSLRCVRQDSARQDRAFFLIAIVGSLLPRRPGPRVWLGLRH